MPLRYYGDPEEFLRACAERARAEGGLHAGRAFEHLIRQLEDQS